MGSENLFHKRKIKKASDLMRKKATRNAYDRVLLVCEGEKTEPNYFHELINYYKLNSANIEIDGTCGSSPKSVFQRAWQVYKEEELKGDSFDRVYCIFDKDTHSSYSETIKKIKSMKPVETFYSAVSVPCFEFWILLHYISTTKPYASNGKLSAADMVIKDLKQYIPNYEKNHTGLFKILVDQLEFAKSNASRVNKQASLNYTDNPSTTVDELVYYLQNIKNN